VAERLKALASKASVRETVPWVQIPPSPPLVKLIFLLSEAHDSSLEQQQPIIELGVYGLKQRLHAFFFADHVADSHQLSRVFQLIGFI
jgi:hypothetical protein